MKNRFLVFTVFLTFHFVSKPSYSQQNFSVKGFVFNAETEKPISNAHIVVIGDQIGTSSNNEGNFELKLAAGKYNLRITSIGFSEKELVLRVPAEIKEIMKVSLRPKDLEISGVDVFGNYAIANRDSSIDRAPVSILPAITYISAIEIEKQGAATLIDAMKFVPGGWTENRGRKTKQFFTIRGQKYPYPDYSVDGVWQKEFEETGYYFSALDIESIEIIRSSSALVKGLSGLTGVIDVKTKKPERETASFTAKYGELNNYLTALQYGNKINDLSFSTSATFFGTDGPPGMNGKERIGNFHGTLDWKINEKLTLSAGATYIQGLRQLVSIEEEIGAPSIKSRIERYDPVKTLLTYVKMNYAGNDGSLTEVQANLTDRKVDFANYNVSKDTTAWSDENDWEYGLNVLHSRPLSTTNTLRIGGLYNHWVAPNGKRYYTGRSANVHTYSGVLTDEQKVGKFLFDAGVRIIGGYIVEWGGFGIEGSGSGFQKVPPIEDEAAPFEWQSIIGASYVLSGFSSLHYNFSGGTIAPRKGSLTAEGTSPENEARFQHDLGFRYKSPSQNEISVSSFYTKRKNAIDFSGQIIVTDGDLVMELYENLDKRSYGVEVSGKLNVPALHSNLFANALFMNAKKEEEDNKMAEDKQLPKVILNGGLYFDYSGFDANLFINYTGPYSNNRFVNPVWVKQNGDFPLGDFVSIDFTTGYTFSGKFSTRVFIEVKNILDEKYYTVAGYPDPGRIFQAGVKIYY